ncbi:MAG TPA: DNA primase [Tepidisphaeraceae bacterium]|jgi:DNA primase|nr:DNA primase [Tepidisphaeraceae bacterium]
MAHSSSNNIDFKSQVLAATDIVELIGQTVPLRKASGSRFTGLCPFHSEKSPSFSVDQSKQFFYCFGCKEHGNAIDFVMKRDRVEFIDALKTLGARAGLEMPKFGLSKEKTSERQILLDAHSAAASFYQQNLSHSEIGKPARDYLAQRGFTADSITAFQIGVAPAAWDSLLRSPLMKKFEPGQLHLGGLAKFREKGGGHYDTFRNRLIFPIRDESARVIAFGGRVMPGSEDPAKYLNSPETPLFSKSRCVFGLDLAKQRIVSTRTVVIVEGYTDVVMAHQFDCTNVVSVLGTALTEQHVSLLKRFADKIVFLFDPDLAGDLAAERAVEVALTGTFKDVRIATLPDGADPDEFLLQHGKEKFERILSDAPDAFAFRWTQMYAKHSTDGVVDQDSAISEFLRPFDRARLAGTVDQLRWGFILTRLSRLLEMPAEKLNRIFDIRKNITRPAPPAPQTAQNTPPVIPPSRPKPPASARINAQRWILGCLLIEPSRWTQIQQHIHVDDFTDPSLKSLAEIYWTHQRDEGEPEFSELLSLIQDPVLAELAIELVEIAQTFPDLKVALQGALDCLTREREQEQQQKLVAELRRKGVADSASDQSDADLLRQLFDRKKSQPPP